MLKVKRNVYFIAFMCLFMCTYANAINYDPAQYITKQTHLLRANESIGNVKQIELDGKPYYVAQIVVNNNTAGYIALHRFEKKIVSEPVESKRLFQTMHFLSLYMNFKKRVSENQSYIWFILQYEQISTIKQALETEKYELALIAQVANTEGIVNKVSNLKSMLNSIIADLDELHKLALDTVSFESDFLNTPKAGEETELKKKLLDCYNKLEEIFRKKQKYEALLVQLRIDIANDPKLSVDEKKSLQKTSELPEEANAIDSWHSSAISMHFKENIKNIYLSAVESSSTFAGKVAMRIKRDSCYRFLYEENSKLEKATNNELMTLKSAYDLIMDSKYYEKWQNREQLREFKTNWAKAVSNFEKEDYENAMRYAKKALDNAIAVYRDGFFQRDNNKINYDLLFKALIAIAVILIGILIIKYVMGKKGQLFGMGDENYEEVNIEKV